MRRMPLELELPHRPVVARMRRLSSSTSWSARIALDLPVGTRAADPQGSCIRRCPPPRRSRAGSARACVMTTSPVGERWSRSRQVLARERQDAERHGVGPGRMEVAGREGGQRYVAPVGGHRPDPRGAAGRRLAKAILARWATRRARVVGGSLVRRRRGAAVRRPSPTSVLPQARAENASASHRATSPARARRREAARAGSAPRSHVHRPEVEVPSRSVAKMTRDPSGSQAGSSSRPAAPARSCFEVPSAFMRRMSNSPRIRSTRRCVVPRGPGGRPCRRGRVGQPAQRVRGDLQRVDVAAAHEGDAPPVRRPGRLGGVLGRTTRIPVGGATQREPSLADSGDRRRLRRRGDVGGVQAEGTARPGKRRTPESARPPLSRSHGTRPQGTAVPDGLLCPRDVVGFPSRCAW